MQRKNIYLTDAQGDFLEGLEGLTLSEHIRRAIDMYIKEKRTEMITATKSPSKMKIFYRGEEIPNE